MENNIKQQINPGPPEAPAQNAKTYWFTYETPGTGRQGVSGVKFDTLASARQAASEVLMRLGVREISYEIFDNQIRIETGRFVRLKPPGAPDSN